MHVGDYGIDFNVALLFEEIEIVVKNYKNKVRFYVNFLEDTSCGYLGEHIFLAEFNEIDFMMTIRGKNKISVISIKDCYDDVVKLINQDVKSLDNLNELFIVNGFREKIVDKMENGALIDQLFKIYFLKDILSKYGK